MKGKLLITLLVIIILVVYAYFGMDYLKQRREHEALASQIADVSQTLSQMPEPPHDMEQRLADAQSELSAEQSVFPGDMNSTRIIDDILKLADDCGIKVLPLATRPWSIENTGEHSYRVFRLDAAVEGNLPQLVSFLSKLEDGEFKTIIVENLSVTRLTEQSGGETTAGGTIPVTARLALAIYTQPLDSE